MQKFLFIILNIIISSNVIPLGLALITLELLMKRNDITNDIFAVFFGCVLLAPILLIPLKLIAFVLLSSICINCKFLDGFFESFEADSNFRNKVLFGALGLDLLCFLPLFLYLSIPGHFSPEGLDFALFGWLWCGGGVLICYLSLFVWNKIIALLEKI